jgi:hypothetical protein
MSWRGFAQRFAGLHDADAGLGPRRNSLTATARPTATATALTVPGAAARERVSLQTSDDCPNAGELEISPDQTELGFRDEEYPTSSQAGLLAALALSVAAVRDRI